MTGKKGQKECRTTNKEGEWVQNRTKLPCGKYIGVSFSRSIVYSSIRHCASEFYGIRAPITEDLIHRWDCIWSLIEVVEEVMTRRAG
jgi:hypothetical protein